MIERRTEKRLRLHLELEQSANDLARIAMETIRPGSGLARRLAQHDVKTAQMRQLQRQVMAAGGVAEIESWIRYQIARPDTKRQWGESGLGRAVLAGINRLRVEKARQIAAVVYPGRGDEHVAEIWLELMRRYAGYLVRQFVAVRGD